MMGGLLFPKPGGKKKRKSHKRSILQRKDGTCYLCARLHGDYRQHPVLHEHHVFGGPNRDISEAEGFKVYLCPAHHLEGPEAVHRNINSMRLIQRDAQATYEKTHTREEFMAMIGRNFLEGESERQEENPAAGFWFIEEQS